MCILHFISRGGRCFNTRNTLLFKFYVLYLAVSFTRRRPTSHWTIGGGTPYTSTDTEAGRPTVSVSGFGSCESSICGTCCSSPASILLTGSVRRIVFESSAVTCQHSSISHTKLTLSQCITTKYFILIYTPHDRYKNTMLAPKWPPAPRKAVTAQWTLRFIQNVFNFRFKYGLK